MRIFLFFALLVLSALPAFGQTNRREVNLRVNDVGFGASYTTVIREFGKPLRSKKERLDGDHGCIGEAPETQLTLFYSGLRISLVGDGKRSNLKVSSIEVKSKKWLASGIAISAEAKDVITKFGETYDKFIEEESGETIFYYNYRSSKDYLDRVFFYFRDNKLVKVRMEAGC